MFLRYKKVKSFLLVLLISILSVVYLFPIYEMVSTSLKLEVDAFSIPPTWFFIPTLTNYKNVFFSNNFGRYFANSIIVSLTATLASVGLGAMAGYALARFQYRGKRLMLVLILLLRMIPPAILVIPVFIIWNDLHLINTHIGLIIVYVALNLSFNIWMLKAFIEEIPQTIDESARLEGCSHWQVFRLMIVPLLAPALAVTSVFTFRLSWNEFLLALVLSNRLTRTLPVAISLFLTDAGIEWGNITAMATIIAIPAFIFTFSSAKNLIAGVSAGAIKG